MRGFFAKAILFGWAATAGAVGPQESTPPNGPPDTATILQDPPNTIPKPRIPRWTSLKRMFAANDDGTLSAETTGANRVRTADADHLAEASAQEPLAPTEALPSSAPASDIPMSPAIEPSEVAEGAIVESSTTQRAIPQEPAGAGWYNRLDYVYWTATDPKPVGSAFNVYPGNADANISFLSPTERIRIDDPNTDHEMGFRYWLGAHSSDRFAVEWGLLWVNATNYFEQFVSRPVTGNGFTTVPAETVRLAGTDEPLDFANMSWRSRYWGTEFNGRYHLMEGPIWYFDAVGGLRYFQYDERLVFEYDRDVRSTLAITRRERFNTDNDLLGPQFGGDLKLRLFEYVTWDSMGRVGLMANMQQLEVIGPDAGQGRFTNTSNLGNRQTTDFSPLFELNSGITLELTPTISFHLGYTIIWIGNLLRATEQVDLGNIGGNPVTSLATDDVWIRGFTGSVQVKW